jgi:hypothetical protein
VHEAAGRTGYRGVGVALSIAMTGDTGVPLSGQGDRRPRPNGSEVGRGGGVLAAADDLPGYAGALFDALVADPGLQRLSQWRMLEFPDASQAEIEAHVSKATQIAEHNGVSLNVATDVMMIALAAVLAWNTTAVKIRNPLGDDPTERLAEHRKTVVTAVAAMTDALLGS